MSLRAYLGSPEPRVAFEAALGATLHKGGHRFLRRRLPPALSELAALADGMFVDPASLLGAASWWPPGASATHLHELGIEHRELLEEITERTEAGRLAFPAVWAVEAATSFLLYSLIRCLKPSVVVEVGVGNGQSSFVILRGLAANGRGRLHSFDITPEAGGLLAPAERLGWDFRLVDPCGGPRSLVAQVATLPRAGLCFHDAGHGYLAQYFEFRCLWDLLADDGVLVSDDVDASYAFIDFCLAEARLPDMLFDRRKAVGVLCRGQRAAGSTDVPPACPRSGEPGISGLGSR